jgi:WD40 repeat protein
MIPSAARMADIRATRETRRPIIPQNFKVTGDSVSVNRSGGHARLWDTRTGAACATLEEHTNWVRAVVFSPVGQLVTLESDARMEPFWDVRMDAAYGTRHRLR